MYDYRSATLKPVNVAGAVLCGLVLVAGVAAPFLLIPRFPALWWLWLLIAVTCIALAAPPFVLWAPVLARARDEARESGVLDVVPVIKGDFPHDESGMERMFDTGWLRFTDDGITVVANTWSRRESDASAVVAFVPYRRPLEATTTITDRGWAYPRLRLTSGAVVLDVEIMTSPTIWRGASAPEVGAVATRVRTRVFAHVSPR